MDDHARWSLLEQVFHRALELDANGRAEYLRTACGSDEELRRRIESLLHHDDSPAAVPAEPVGPRIGPYEVVRKLGAGGMGEVYLARDGRLDREVALKILPQRFAEDAERRRRFLQEAKAASALNHPHIVTVYDVGTQGSVDYLVMEYVAGKPLDRLIPHFGLKLEEALHYAMQIASALAAAHNAGIIHRDLKPANILVSESGIAKVADFGLAKQMGRGPNAATVTEEGVVRGTAAYMSPEQAAGRPIDARSDIFSFGAVLYEMVTGRRAFPGHSAASVMAAILEHDPPPFDAPNGDTPSVLDRTIRRCLEKDPALRWQTAQELSTELESIAQYTALPGTAIGRSSRYKQLAWMAAAMLVVALIVLLLAKVLGRERPAPVQTVRFTLPAPETTTLIPAAPAVSPDGTVVAFLAATDGRALVWVRPIGSPVSRPLAGTEGASTLFWSPDSRFLAFIAGNELKKMEISSGSVSTVCGASAKKPGAWNPNGTIIFSPSDWQPLQRVQVGGGVPAPVTVIDHARGDYQHAWPQWLPDGRNFLYFVQTNRPETTGIYASSVGSFPPTAKLIAKTRAAGIYVPSRHGPNGYLLFLRDEILLAQAFDPFNLKFNGEPVRIAERRGRLMSDYAGDPGFSVSQTVLAYHSFVGSRAQLVWLDRSGTHKGILGVSDVWSHPDLSADGDRAAFDAPNPTTLHNDIWLADARRGITSRFSYDPATDGVPIWSRSGDRIVFNSVRKGPRNLYWKPTDGGQEEPLLESAESKVASDWSPESSFCSFKEMSSRAPGTSGRYLFQAIVSRCQ
jgi:eukaryotic-like serine/threonine-protein kinase